MTETLLTMSKKELLRLETIQAVLEKRLKQNEAAKRLGLTPRQVRRLKTQYQISGAETLVSKHRGKPSNRAFKAEYKSKVLEHIKATYSDFGPTLASEKLMERHALSVNKETLRQWMISEGFWNGKSRKRMTVHQQRARRASLGELVQIDGSPHDWFEGRAPKCCLLVFIDDATSQIMQLHFVPTESTLGYFEATEQYIRQHGRPQAFYSDKHGIFRINAKEAQSGTGESQFGRALRELGIELICANSPQAKGRVERANNTLQDRLVKELRLQNINDIESANLFAPTFTEKFNTRFSVSPKSSENVHRTNIPEDETLDLIFSHQKTRTLSKNLELSYKNVIYQIKTQGKGYAMRHSKVTVCDNLKGGVVLKYKGKVLEYEIFDKKNQPIKPTSSKELDSELDKDEKIDGRTKGHKPKVDHPWRDGYKIQEKKAA